MPRHQTNDDKLRQAMIMAGSKGGSRGGPNKIRGDHDYYRQLALRAVEKRRKKKEAVAAGETFE